MLDESFVLKVHKSSRQMLNEVYAAPGGVDSWWWRCFKKWNFRGNLFDLKLSARLVSLVIFSSINRSPIEFSLIQKDITRWRSKLYLHVPRSSYTYTWTWESFESSSRSNYDESIPFGTRQSALAHWTFWNVCHFYFFTKWHIKPVEAAKWCEATKKSSNTIGTMFIWLLYCYRVVKMSCIRWRYTLCTLMLIHLCICRLA